MDVVLASDVTMLIYKDGDYRPFVCATDLSIDTTMEIKQVRTIGDGKWKKPRGQSLSYTISLSGIITLVGGDPTAFYVLEFMRQMIPLSFRILFDDPVNNLQKIIEGIALPVSGSLPSGAEGFANCQFEMQGDGEYVITDSLVTCTATIDQVVVSPDTSEGAPAGRISFNYTGASSNTIRIEYSIDGGGRETVFNEGAPNGVVFVTGNYTGTHELTLYPICEDGAEGIPLIEEFTR